jgi:hypothetical protein
MKNKTQMFLRAVCLLAALASLEAVSSRALADDDSPFRSGLQGSWAVQFTGTVNLPPPINAFNGPFYRNARLVVDGHGNLHATAVSNYNGTVGHETFSGTYTLNQDGTFTIMIPNLPIPFLPPGVPNVFTFEGVLAGGGKIAKVALSGVNIGGVQQANIGSVIAGELIKQ